MRLGAMLFVAFAAASAAGWAHAAPGDAACRADLAGAAFKPLDLCASPRPPGPPPRLKPGGPVPLRRGLHPRTRPGALDGRRRPETGRLAPLTPPSGRARGSRFRQALADGRGWTARPARHGRGVESAPGFRPLEPGLRRAGWAGTGRGWRSGRATAAGGAWPIPWACARGPAPATRARWFLFAALRDRAIGWNVVGGRAGRGQRWASCRTTAAVSPAEGQAGLGYRRGAPAGLARLCL